MKNFALLLLLVTVLTGCFGQRFRTSQIDAEKIKVRNLLAAFEESIDQNECYKAENYKEKLFGTKIFSNPQVKTVLLTKLCLCYLEAEGNIGKFSGCSSELKDISKNLSHLRKETQFVLEFGNFISQGRPSEDERISPEIRDALILIFQGGEK